MTPLYTKLVMVKPHPYLDKRDYMPESATWLEFGEVFLQLTIVLKMHTLKKKVYKKYSDCKWREKIEY
jgi:hypothetical protein